MVDRRRLFRAQYQDIQLTQQIGAGRYYVNGSRGKEYEVDINTPYCTCPDWQDREPNGGCKHILRMKIEDGRLDSPSWAYRHGSSGTAGQYPSNWSRLRERTIERDGSECQMCGWTQNSHTGLDVHHIKPKSQGGAHKPSNLITLCRSCHEDLHGQTIPDPSPSYNYSSGPEAGGHNSSPEVDHSGESSEHDGRNTGNTSGHERTEGRSETISGKPHPFDLHKSMLPPWSQSYQEDYTEETANSPGSESATSHHEQSIPEYRTGPPTTNKPDSSSSDDNSVSSSNTETQSSRTPNSGQSSSNAETEAKLSTSDQTETVAEAADEGEQQCSSESNTGAEGQSEEVQSHLALFHNSSWKKAKRSVLAPLLSLGCVILVFIYLGETPYGLFGNVFAAGSVLVLLSSAVGFPFALSYYIARDQQELKEGGIEISAHHWLTVLTLAVLSIGLYPLWHAYARRREFNV